MTTYKSIFIEETFQYKMSNNDSFHPRRVEELTYIDWQFLRLFSMWLLFTVTYIKPLANVQIVTLFFFFFLPVEKLLENTGKDFLLLKKKKRVRKAWNILAMLNRQTSPSTAVKSWRKFVLGLAVNQDCPSCMSFMYSGAIERQRATLLKSAVFF